MLLFQLAQLAHIDLSTVTCDELQLLLIRHLGIVVTVRLIFFFAILVTDLVI